MANVANERSRSVWMDMGPAISAAPLGEQVSCDVLVVGAGIAGLSCAYELSRLGREVVVIDRGAIGSGMTARTTAHLASALDDYYSELIRIHGKDQARLYHDSQVAAINRIEAICHDEAIDADFVRLDGYLFPAEPAHLADLEQEYEACREIGVEVEWADRAPMPGFDTGRCLRFARQARFQPTKYLAGLAASITQSGGRLFSDTAYIDHEEDDEGVVVRTETGHQIRANAAVFATNSPINNRVAIHTKLLPNRTYALAGVVPKSSVEDCLAWDTLEAYHYVRLQPLDDQFDLLIVGGEDHRAGQADDMEQRLQAIEAWTRERYSSLGEIRYRWSGQVLEPVDYMPFSGRNPGDRNIYIHSGDSGQGLTNAVAGSLTIAPLILGQHSRFAEMFEPSRKPLGGAALNEFAEGLSGAVANLAEHLGPSEVASVDQIAPGQGAILRDGSLAKLAVYRTEDGRLIKCSATCTHVGCVVHWNPFEKCWDCPCHGSQFGVDGEVLNGPALKALAKAEG